MRSRGNGVRSTGNEGCGAQETRGAEHRKRGVRSTGNEGCGAQELYFEATVHLVFALHPNVMISEYYLFMGLYVSQPFSGQALVIIPISCLVAELSCENLYFSKYL